MGKTAVLAAIALALSAMPAQGRDSEAQIKQQIVKESRDRYPGTALVRIIRTGLGTVAAQGALTIAPEDMRLCATLQT